MIRPLALIVTLLAVFTSTGRAAGAAQATRLTLAGPETVQVGEAIELEARLHTARGEPVPEAVLELRQVGAVGERVLDEATTDAQGTALLSHREYTVPQLTLRVVFRGTPAREASHADLSVAVTGIAVEPSVVMAHSPGPAIKATLFLLLGSVWLTYVYAVSRVARIVLDHRSIGEGGRAQ